MARTYKSYFLIFCCAVTGMANVQLIERKDTAAVLDGCSRFFNEAGVPKIMLPDDDGALTRAFTLGEISLTDFSRTIHKKKGIHFELCPPQGSSAHGQVERRIQMLQDSLEKSGMRNSCSTVTMADHCQGHRTSSKKGSSWISLRG